MRLVRFILPIVLCLPIGFAQQTPILFEGARLINGDGSVTENSAFVIENGKFTSVGKKGAVKAPPGATSVNLAGKSVMPALIDTHVHLLFGGLHQIQKPDPEVERITREAIASLRAASGCLAQRNSSLIRVSSCTTAPCFRTLCKDGK